MSHPDHALWRAGWRANRIDFHQHEVNPSLLRFWLELALAASDRVFVPLCGKSLDLLWLYRQGHPVTGVELSPVAVQAFFQESRLPPKRASRGALVHWAHERMEIFCGDFFQLGASDLVGVKAVYDRASLTALPEELRASYVAHLRAILPADCVIFLLTEEDLDDEESESAAIEASEEIQLLYADGFEIELRHAECFPAVMPTGDIVAEPRSVHKVYLIRRGQP